jgi:hypothetical protein
MADIMSILSSNYTTVGANTAAVSHTKYVNVDAKSYEGSWTGKYKSGQPFTISVSNVSGFKAKVRYKSGSVVNSQDVLIKDGSFKFGDSKFTLTKAGVAQIKTVMTNASTGGQTLETTTAQQG